MEKILIIGGAGFVGSNLAYYLKDYGYNITVLDNLVRRGVENNLPEFKLKGIDFIHGDIRNPEDLNNIKNINIVLNCAAQPTALNYENPTFDITNNTLGTLNVLEFCRRNGCGLIFWSTNKVYSGEVCNSLKLDFTTSNTRFYWDKSISPFQGFNRFSGFSENLSIDGKEHSIYGVSKVMADLMVQEWASAFNIPSIVNRFSCLSKDTLIRTKYGDTKLCDIFKECNVMTNNHYKKTSTGSFLNGKEELYKLTTKNGYTIKATKDHLLYCPEGYKAVKDINYGSFIEILPNSQIRINHNLLPDENIITEEMMRAFLNREDLYFSKSFVERAIKQLTKQGLLPLKYNNKFIYILAQMTGYFFGDGHIGLKNSKRKDNGKNQTLLTLQIYDKFDENLLLIKDDLKEMGVYCSDIFTNYSESKLACGQIIKGTSKKICVSNNAFNSLMFLLGVPSGRKASKEYLIPDWILKSHKDVKAAFLSGIFGAEGSCPNVLTSNRKGNIKFELKCLGLTQCKNVNLKSNLYDFMGQIGTLLKEFGIKSSFYDTLTYDNNDGSTSFGREIRIGQSVEVYKLFGQIGFSYNKKRQRNLSFINEFNKTNLSVLYYDNWIKERTFKTSGSDMLWDYIISKEKSEITEVMDMTIPDGNNFIANGFHVHNCLAGPNQWGKAEQGWLTWFAIANHFKLPIKVYGFGGRQVRDYLFIDDLCNLIHKQIKDINNFKGEVFNVGGGINQTTSVKEAINHLDSNYKEFVGIDYIEKTRRADQAIYISDVTKVCHTFDWKPKIKLEEGYIKVFKWIKENESKLESLYL